MVLIWHDAQSFQQHLEDMRIFRQSHRDNPEDGLKTLKAMPSLENFHPPSQTGGNKGFISTRRKSILVPIWEIALPRGSQN